MSAFLLLDCGNTSVKCARYDVATDALELLHGDWREVVQQALSQGGIERVLISSVRSVEQNSLLKKYLSSLSVAPLFFAQTAKSEHNLTVAYEDVSRLGVDRWLVMLAASAKAVGGDFVVADVGTALTVDYVVGNEHQGGYIAPGLDMLGQALNQNTSNINAKQQELLVQNAQVFAWGQDTHQCVAYGTRRMMCALLADVQRELLSVSAQDCKFYICGGGANALLDGLDGAWWYAPTLVFDGLLIAAGVINRG